jgi:anti-sigma factor RsiW
MTRPKITDDVELMQHADGELPGELRGALASDPDAQRKLEALGELRELVRGHLELATDETDDRRFQEMWRGIDRALDAGAPRGLWGRVSSWLDRHRGHLLTGVVSAGAVAALALILRPDAPGTGEMTMDHGVIDVRPVSMRSPPAIEALDTPDGTGTVLNYEDEDGHTAVIWVTPADTVEGI